MVGVRTVLGAHGNAHVKFAKSVGVEWGLKTDYERKLYTSGYARQDPGGYWSVRSVNGRCDTGAGTGGMSSTSIQRGEMS